MKLIARLVAAATIVTGLGVVGAGTVEAGPCQVRATSAAFQRWGDHNQYFVADGGTFEGWSSAWEMRGAAWHGFGQNPHGYAGPGQRSLQLSAWGAVKSPSMCVFENEDALRFAYKAPHAGAILQVWVEVENERGYAYTSTYITAADHQWNISPIIDMPSLRDPQGQQWVTVYIMALDAWGTWMVDDVMIDPWITR
jgi:hypothetical protein